MGKYSNKQLRRDITALEEELRAKKYNNTLTISESDQLNAITKKPVISGGNAKGDQGLLRGGSDELTSAVTSFFPSKNRKILAEVLKERTGENFSNYDIDLAKYRKELETNRGIIPSVQEMGGAVLPYLLGNKIKGVTQIGKIGKEIINPTNVRTAAAGAAADAGTYGFLGSEGGFINRALDAGMNATIAAPLGMIGYAFTKSIDKVGKWLRPLTREQGVNKARQIIANNLKEDNGTVRSAINKVLEAKNSKTMLADLNDEGDTLVSYLSALPYLDVKTGKEVRKLLEDRDKGGIKRLFNLFTGNSKMGNLIDNLSILKEAREKTASPIYKKAYYYINNKTEAKGALKTINLDDNLDGIFSTEMFPDILKRAKVIASESGDKLNLQVVDGALLDMKGNKVNKIPIKYLHHIKIGYDDWLSQGLKPDSGKILGAAVVNNKNKLVDFMDKASPDYKKAREIYAGNYELATAMELGDSITLPKVDYHDVMRQIKTMNKSELEAFKLGAIDAYRREMEKKGGSKAANSIINNESNKKILKMVITGNADLSKHSPKFDSFYKRLMQELNTKRTSNQVLGNSQTSEKIAAGQELIGEALDAPSFDFGSIVNSLFKQDLNETNKAYRKSMAQELKRILTAFGEKDLRIIQSQLEGGKTWGQIIKSYPSVFKTILKAPTSTAGISFGVNEAGDYGYRDEAKGYLEGQLGQMGF